MKKALAGVLVLATIGLMAGSALGQVPNVQVYFDPLYHNTQSDCPAEPPPGPVPLYVVMNNWNMWIRGVDFSIEYPGALIWVADLPPNENAVVVGQSGGIMNAGVAVAWNIAQDGTIPVLALMPLVLWGNCNCSIGPQALVVEGYNPLGKTHPTATRDVDFVEFPGVGMTSLVCPGGIATEPTTWGQVKALYR
jgi:hypothetical protein